MLTKVKKVTKTITFPCLYCEGTGKLCKHYATPECGEWEEVEECPHCEGTGEYTVRVTAPESFWELFQVTCPCCSGTGKVVEAMYDEQLNPHEITCTCPLCDGEGVVSKKLSQRWKSWKSKKPNPILVAEIDELEF